MTARATCLQQPRQTPSAVPLRPSDWCMLAWSPVACLWPASSMRRLPGGHGATLRRVRRHCEMTLEFHLIDEPLAAGDTEPVSTTLRKVADAYRSAAT